MFILIINSCCNVSECVRISFLSLRWKTISVNMKSSRLSVMSSSSETTQSMQRIHPKKCPIQQVAVWLVCDARFDVRCDVHSICSIWERVLSPALECHSSVLHLWRNKRVEYVRYYARNNIISSGIWQRNVGHLQLSDTCPPSVIALNAPSAKWSLSFHYRLARCVRVSVRLGKRIIRLGSDVIWSRIFGGLISVSHIAIKYHVAHFFRRLSMHIEYKCPQISIHTMAKKLHMSRFKKQIFRRKQLKNAQSIECTARRAMVTGASERLKWKKELEGIRSVGEMQTANETHCRYEQNVTTPTMRLETKWKNAVAAVI